MSLQMTRCWLTELSAVREQSNTDPSFDRKVWLKKTLYSTGALSTVVVPSMVRPSRSARAASTAASAASSSSGAGRKSTLPCAMSSGSACLSSRSPRTRRILMISCARVSAARSLPRSEMDPASTGSCHSAL